MSTSVCTLSPIYSAPRTFVTQDRHRVEGEKTAANKYTALHQFKSLLSDAMLAYFRELLLPLG